MRNNNFLFKLAPYDVSALFICEKDIDSTNGRTLSSSIRAKLAVLREQVNSALHKFEREVQQETNDEIHKLRTENEKLKQRLVNIRKMLGMSEH